MRNHLIRLSQLVLLAVLVTMLSAVLPGNTWAQQLVRSTITNATLAVTQSGTWNVGQSGTWTVQPGNTANTTAWKVDGSAVIQPVSGTFWQATQPVSIATNTPVGGTAHDGAASAVNPLLMGCYASAAAPTDVSADTDAVREWCLRNGARAMQPTYAGVLQSTGNGVAGTGTPRVTIASDNTAFSVNAVQSGTWTVQPGNTANSTPWLTTDSATSATGSAVPAKGAYLAGNGTGNLTGLTICDSNKFLDMTTATTAEMVALTSSQKVRVCSFSIESNGTAVVTFKYGTGTNCGTGTTQLGPAWDLTAQTGLSQGAGIGELFAGAASNAVCLTSSAAVNVHAWISYTKY